LRGQPLTPPRFTLALLIPHPAPDQKTARTLLIALRRIAAGGIDDASAANLLLGSFGMGYRRPLLFPRVLMQEISRVSRQPISIAPYCCPRMTEGEAAIHRQRHCTSRRRPRRARARHRYARPVTHPVGGTGIGRRAE
jgi:hypothetical protein